MKEEGTEAFVTFVVLYATYDKMHYNNKDYFFMKVYKTENISVIRLFLWILDMII